MRELTILVHILFAVDDLLYNDVRYSRIPRLQGVAPPLRRLVVLRGVLVVGIQGVNLQGVNLQRVDLQGGAHRLTLHRGTLAVLNVGIRGEKDTRILEGWVREVGVILLWLRVLDSWCLLVVVPLLC